eukprot:CAMPEP_0201571468 /NCGR_PEP_ID=MMETSP0190_2-20130828/14244_1 /ASSEMBLY_ACC=CAM_ASM_000263 /TAXON_ID=37353 /ORGANISM="Rosalina sp." /LENGTH=218 /DNA_ID=CAMNT_0047996147 /DNA_START=63 /DNA_END=719 /DNA_ORIENTATION=-
MSFRKKSMLKVIVLGDSGVGKTSVLDRFVNSKFDSRYKATIGADFLSKEVNVDDTVVSMQVWDTAGQERFATLGVAFYRGADAVILVYDISDPISFKNISQWKQDFIDNGSPNKPNEFPFILFGNKCDLPSNKKKVHSTEVENWIKQNGANIPFYETSAKSATNIEQGFNTVASLAIKYNQSIDGDSGYKFKEVTFDDDFKKGGKARKKKDKCDCTLL